MISAPELREKTREAWHRAFTPPRRLTISQWADEERYLSPEYNAIATRARGPVKWSTDTVPYLRDIMDALSDDSIREITFMKSAQVGGSECGQNWLGWTVCESPTALLMVFQTLKAMRAFSTKRMDPMIRDTPALIGKLPSGGRREKSNTIESKQFPGGYLQFLTAKSTADLRSHSAGRLLAEEIDEWEGDVGKQGDPLELLRARGTTFGDAVKLYKVSTPSLEGYSRIATEYAESSQGKFHVPCPACGEFQELIWRDGETGRYRFHFEKDAGGRVIESSVRYICTSCGVMIEEKHRPAMLAAGKWVHALPERIHRNCGFHIWKAYAPSVSWGTICHDFVRSAKDPAKLKAFVNTTLGQTFREEGTRLEPHFLAQRAEPYPMTGKEDDVLLVPKGVGLLTSFIDVQGDRLELFTYGWGAGEEAWWMGWELLEGDPGQDAVWRAAEAALFRTWTHESGAPMVAAGSAVDAGYQTKAVWDFCQRWRQRGVIATVGRDGARPIIQKPGPQAKKKSKDEHRPMHIIGTDSAKDQLAARLRITDVGPKYIHFPDTIDPVFFEQITSERLVTTYRRTRAIRTWDIIPGRRNEGLDGTIGCFARLHAFGAKVIAQLGPMAQQLSDWKPSKQAVTPATGQQRRGRMLNSGMSHWNE